MCLSEMSFKTLQSSVNFIVSRLCLGGDERRSRRLRCLPPPADCLCTDGEMRCSDMQRALKTVMDL